MPFVSETRLATLKDSAQNLKNKAIVTAKKAKEERSTNQLFALGEGLLGAAAAGYARGRWSEPNGVWVVPGTEIDVELLAVVGLLGVALVGDQMGLDNYQSHAQNLAVGIGAHYMGLVATNAAKTGTWDLAGAATPKIEGGLPQYDPTSYDPTQLAAPYDDPTAAALASSGV